MKDEPGRREEYGSWRAENGEKLLCYFNRKKY
jgi:hypothetical protein